jgi:hypothetical protein
MSNKANTYRGHPKFYDVLNELAVLHDRKNHDYAGENDPLRNLRQCEDMGIPSWKGVAVRMTDKMDRIKSFAKKEAFEVNDEGLSDTLMDMAVYSILALILYEERADVG